MIETGMGPVFAFCETGIKCTFISQLHRSGMLRRLDPHTLLDAEVEKWLGGRELAGDYAELVGKMPRLANLRWTEEDAALLLGAGLLLRPEPPQLLLRGGGAIPALPDCRV